MEHLTKQQIVLLTLLVSFVTSIATGIVTVALMDQAPVGVTSTINHVIERTVETVVPATGTNQAAVITSIDPQTQVSNALNMLQKSVVSIKNVTGYDSNGVATGSVTGIGLVVSKSGLIVTDKAAIVLYGNYAAQLPNGTTVPVQIIQSQTDGDLVFLLAQVPVGKTAASLFTPVTFAADIPKLGQTVLAFSGTDSPTLGQGFVTNVTPATNISSATFTSSIDSSKATTAVVSFTTAGQVLGLKTLSGTTYPAVIIKSAIPTQ